MLDRLESADYNRDDISTLFVAGQTYSPYSRRPMLMLYCAQMDTEADISVRMITALRKARLESLALLFLEASEPFALIGAQAAYFMEPLFQPSSGWIHEFASILESQSARQRLAHQLRKERES